MMVGRFLWKISLNFTLIKALYFREYCAILKREVVTRYIPMAELREYTRAPIIKLIPMDIVPIILPISGIVAHGSFAVCFGCARAVIFICP